MKDWILAILVTFGIVSSSFLVIVLVNEYKEVVVPIFLIVLLVGCVILWHAILVM